MYQTTRLALTISAYNNNNNNTYQTFAQTYNKLIPGNGHIVCWCGFFSVFIIIHQPLPHFVAPSIHTSCYLTLWYTLLSPSIVYPFTHCLFTHLIHSITSRLTMIYEDNIVKQTKNRGQKNSLCKKNEFILWLVKLIGVILFYGSKLDAVFFSFSITMSSFTEMTVRYILWRMNANQMFDDENSHSKCFTLWFLRTTIDIEAFPFDNFDKCVSVIWFDCW